jgi:hypothetical protein
MSLAYEDALKFIDGTLNFLTAFREGLFRISPIFFTVKSRSSRDVLPTKYFQIGKNIHCFG